MEKEYEGITVAVNDEGYLTDFTQWTKEIATGIAKEEGIEMTDEHWKVIDYLQDQYRKGIPLTIRNIGKSGLVDIKTFYKLFPNGPLKISSRISGIPKPVGCI